MDGQTDAALMLIQNTFLYENVSKGALSTFTHN